MRIFMNPFIVFFQELEQEKYHLRRRLEVAEEEFDLRVSWYFKENAKSLTLSYLI